MKYLKSITLLGILFFMVSSSLSAQELTAYAGFWKPHFYEDNHEISKKEFKAKIMSDKEAGALWKSYTKRRNLTFVGATIALAGVAWGVAKGEHAENYVGPTIGILGGLGLELGAAISSLKKYRQALLTYNENVEKKDERSTSTSKKTSIMLAPTYNGAGVVVRF